MVVVEVNRPQTGGTFTQGHLHAGARDYGLSFHSTVFGISASRTLPTPAVLVVDIVDVRARCSVNRVTVRRLLQQVFADGGTMFLQRYSSNMPDNLVMLAPWRYAPGCDTWVPDFDARRSKKKEGVASATHACRL